MSVQGQCRSRALETHVRLAAKHEEADRQEARTRHTGTAPQGWAKTQSKRRGRAVSATGGKGGDTTRQPPGTGRTSGDSTEAPEDGFEGRRRGK